MDKKQNEPQITILSKDVINQIAAGEVIERPASVVKELVENSIDADASKIEIIIRDGGLKEITVIDNGYGMSKDNAEIAFNSHSTSKLRSLDDLLRINTFGFRGEALSSIAAISKIEMKTRTKKNETGILIKIEGGKTNKIEETASPIGTSITVKDLFYNVPVRRKYLKSSNTEFGHIVEVVSLMAFANPSVYFQLVHNDREVLSLPGMGKLIENIARRYGNALAKNLVNINFENEWIKIDGYTSNLQESRASKYYMTIIVNKRVIKSQIITNAILDAYRTLLMKNKYPITVINIYIEPELLDVNVHPTKKEVRFSKENEIYEIVQKTIKNTLNQLKVVKEVKLDKRQTKFDETKPSLPEKKVKPVINISEAPRQKSLSDSLEIKKIEGKELQKTELETHTMERLPKMKYHGQIFDTYLLTTNEENFYLIDQHAAHERIRMERLLEVDEKSPLRIQKLLKPIKMEILPGKVMDIKEMIPLLTEYGFEITHFGGTSFIIKGVPVIVKKILKMDEIKDLLDEILHIKGKLSLKDKRNDIIQLLSCKGAIKANTPLSNERAKRLLINLDHCEHPFSCCHGRPTIISFSKNEIEKKFKRK